MAAFGSLVQGPCETNTLYPGWSGMSRVVTWITPWIQSLEHLIRMRSEWNPVQLTCGHPGILTVNLTRSSLVLLIQIGIPGSLLHLRFIFFVWGSCREMDQHYSVRKQVVGAPLFWFSETLFLLSRCKWLTMDRMGCMLWEQKGLLCMLAGM